MHVLRGPHAQLPDTRAVTHRKHHDPGKHQDFVPLLLGPLNPSLGIHRTAERGERRGGVGVVPNGGRDGSGGT